MRDQREVCHWLVVLPVAALRYLSDAVQKKNIAELFRLEQLNFLELRLAFIERGLSCIEKTHVRIEPLPNNFSLALAVAF